MKALLALNESTTAEILADLLGLDPEQAQQIAGQLRLSEILNLIQELKANNMLEANEILKPYVAEKGVNKHPPTPTPKNDPNMQGTMQGTPHDNTATLGSNNVSTSTVGSTRPNVSGEEPAPGEPEPNYTMDIKKDGQQIASSNVGADGAARAIRTGPKGSGKGQGLTALRAAKGVV
jgi:hypothetical protein